MIQGMWPDSWGESLGMWTVKNRKRHERSHLRYPSDLTDEEWQHIAPLIPRAKRGRKRTVNIPDVVNGVMYVLSTRCQWRYLPKDLPPRAQSSTTSICGIMMARWKRFITRYI
jgi:transposase